MGTLPEPFAAWFAARGWTPRSHQLALLRAAKAGQSALLVAPTGGGKTLAGFLPSLVDLTARPRPPGQGALHTLYISPLKALAVDIARNLMAPVEDLSLPIRIETRTGDTPQNRRSRQKEDPPHLLLTTPESLVLLLSQPEAGAFFAGVAAVVRLPRRVGKPARLSRSLTVVGTPSSRPIGRPAIQRASLSPACCRARGFMTAKALTQGL